MAMQAAAKDMIDTLSNYDKQTGDVCISIIPFSKDGNVGATNVSASINWTGWEAKPPILANDKSSAFNSVVAGVTIFTIQVNIHNADAKSQALQDSATLTQISKLRVAKSSASTNEKPGQIWPGS